MNLRNKIFALCLVFMLGITCLNAQSTYVSDSTSSVAGFGGPMLSMGAINGNFAAFLGGSGGLLIKDFSVGAFVLWQTTQITDWNKPENYFNTMCGGIMLGYSFLCDKTVHPVVELLAGLGSMNSFLRSSYAVNRADKSQIYGIIPRLGAEFNLGNYVRIGLGIEYRYFGFMKHNDNFSSSDISSPSGYIVLKLGEF
ncbi:MAG: hypothetical protein GX879_02995 [Bacteroidales bacterium]|nr:hypothetical protein [Bacteroidales bacterium]